MKSLDRLVHKKRRRIVGLMSGTSADGVDAALLEVEALDPEVAGGSITWTLLDFLMLPYPGAIRAEILAVQEGAPRVLERLTRLHFVLGHLFADAVERLIADAGVPLPTLDLVASHGQTVCHFPEFPPGAGDGPLGGVSPSTLQIGEPAVLAERLGVPVISNFRSRDVAAGGTGAPLVPLVDHLLFADPERARLVVNVGGIANFTAIPAGGTREDLIAFDTGPGNMVIDALMGLLTGGRKHLDEGGALARKGKASLEIVDELLEAPFFHQAPPRAAGREQFGLEYAEAMLARCRKAKLTDASILATGTRLTAASIHQAYDRFVRPTFPVEELILSGGGAHNIALLEALAAVFEGVRVVTSDYYGLDVDAKEAAAFALLGHLSLEGEPGNVPGVTGAGHPVVLGSITPGDRAS